MLRSGCVSVTRDAIFINDRSNRDHGPSRPDGGQTIYNQLISLAQPFADDPGILIAPLILQRHLLRSAVIADDIRGQFSRVSTRGCTLRHKVGLHRAYFEFAAHNIPGMTM